MTMTPSSRKRKRGPLDEKESDSLSIELSGLSDTQAGPVLGVWSFSSQCSSPRLSAGFFCHTASFPCLIPPQNTAFNILVGEQDEGKEFVKRASTVSGETDTIEFSGSANDGGDGTGSKFGYLFIPQQFSTHIY